jgi:hypothetical protein
VNAGLVSHFMQGGRDEEKEEEDEGEGKSE